MSRLTHSIQAIWRGLEVLKKGAGTGGQKENQSRARQWYMRKHGSIWSHARPHCRRWDPSGVLALSTGISSQQYGCLTCNKLNRYHSLGKDWTFECQPILTPPSAVGPWHPMTLIKIALLRDNSNNNNSNNKNNGDICNNADISSRMLDETFGMASC